jgi:O-antigen/teichoic acid export membrane protein
VSAVRVADARTIPRTRRLVAGGALVLAGTGIWQLSNFLFNALAARWLSPERYGDLAAAVGLIYLASPVVVSVQTVASRTATTLLAAGRARELRGLVRFYAFRLGFVAVLGAAALALFSRPIAELLHLRSSIPVVLVGVAFVLSLMTHLQRGVLQGLQRFAAFGGGSAVEGVTKLVAVVVLLRLVAANESVAMTAFLIAGAIALVYNGLVLRTLPDTTERVVPLEHPYRYSLETLGTLVGLAVLLSADVIAANRYLPAAAAGRFAAISLAGKTVFFASSAFVSLAFPIFSERQDRGVDPRRAFATSVGIVTAIALAVVGVYAAHPSLLVGAIFGHRYLEVAGAVPWMAAIFAQYAVVYLAAMYLLSQRRAAGPRVLAVAVVAQLAAFRIVHASTADLMRTQALVFGVTAMVLMAFALLGRGRTAEPTEAPWAP